MIVCTYIYRERERERESKREREKERKRDGSCQCIHDMRPQKGTSARILEARMGNRSHFTVQACRNEGVRGTCVRLPLLKMYV